METTAMTTNPLIDHIKSINEKTIAWVNEEPGRGATTYTLDESYWSSLEVNTVEDFDKYILVCSIVDSYKYSYGFKPSWASLMDCSIEELEIIANEASEEAHRRHQMEAKELEYMREEEAYENWIASSYEDRYLAFCEAAGYE